MRHSDLLSCHYIIGRLGAGLISALLLLAGASGCNKAEGPPPPITLEELPSALEKAFTGSGPETSGKLKSVQAALREKDYSKAFMGLQALSGQPGLKRAQANAAAAGLITLNNTLQEAQSQGDQSANQTLQLYHSTK